jgi:hypothetical protein
MAGPKNDDRLSIRVGTLAARVDTFMTLRRGLWSNVASAHDVLRKA